MKDKYVSNKLMIPRFKTRFQDSVPDCIEEKMEGNG